MRSVIEFLQHEISGSIILLATVAFALIWANTRWHTHYDTLFSHQLHIGVGDHAIAESLQKWISDALMALFFLQMGLEVKRETRGGHLSTVRLAALPAIAATGGAILPALIFLAINATSPGRPGWGVPMATDIAFSLGVLMLLRSHVPPAMRALLTTLAIADDILAILVIAIFYPGEFHARWLVVAAAIVLILIALNRLGVRSLVPYLAIGVVLWLAVFESGVQATIAGVLLALTIPVNADSGQSPLHRLEEAVAPITTFFILPLFALANAGVRVEGSFGSAMRNRVTIGVFLGLVIGKQVGIVLSSWLTVRLRIATLPDEIDWRHIWGIGWLGGIGFTVALFVADLAFTDDAHALTNAKIGILAASVVSGIGGYALLRLTSARRAP